MFKKPVPAEQRVVLSDVSWRQFEELLEELGQERRTRLTYLRGKLELMTPMPEHDRCSRLIESLILLVADELGQPVYPRSPVLLKHPEQGCAVEPDACYYFQPGERIDGRTEIDLFQEGPPDLVAEVAITKTTLDKFLIYAQWGIPEVWRYITRAGEDVLKGKLVIHRLQGDRYVETPTSRILPFLTDKKVEEFINQSDAMGLSMALKVLRDWVGTVKR